MYGRKCIRCANLEGSLATAQSLSTWDRAHNERVVEAEKLHVRTANTQNGQVGAAPLFRTSSGRPNWRCNRTPRSTTTRATRTASIWLRRLPPCLTRLASRDCESSWRSRQCCAPSCALSCYKVPSSAAKRSSAACSRLLASSARRGRRGLRASRRRSRAKLVVDPAAMQRALDREVRRHLEELAGRRQDPAPAPLTGGQPARRSASRDARRSGSLPSNDSPTRFTKATTVAPAPGLEGRGPGDRRSDRRHALSRSPRRELAPLRDSLHDMLREAVTNLVTRDNAERELPDGRRGRLCFTLILW